MNAIVLLLGLALSTPAAAQGHPLSDCEVKRGAIGYTTSVTLFCGLAQVADRRLSATASAEKRLDAFKSELDLVTKSVETELTWNLGSIELGGSERLVAQYAVKNDSGILRVGLVAPGQRDDELVECSSADPGYSAACKDLVDAVLTLGLPAGVDFLPFAADARKATVLGKTIKVVPGCKAQWVFDDAVHVACADGELIFGTAATLSADGLGGDPIAGLQEQVGGAGAGKESACTVGGTSTRCWQARVSDGGVPVRLVTARPTLGGQEAMLACTFTALGEVVHPLCAQLLSF